jgi:hypothetical protein
MITARKPLQRLDTSAVEPDGPPGWDYNSSDWSQRLPIVALGAFGYLLDAVTGGIGGRRRWRWSRPGGWRTGGRPPPTARPWECF